MAELFLGLRLETGRWLDNAKQEALRFSELCKASLTLVDVREEDGLWAITSGSRRALILCHPLWHPQEGLAVDAQVNAKLALTNDGYSCEFVDVRELHNKPNGYLLSLQGSGT
jgi:hypothetical protein